MLILTKDLKAFNSWALSGPTLYSSLFGELREGRPRYLIDNVAQTLHEMTLFNVATSEEAYIIFDFLECKVKNLTKLTLLECNYRSTAYEELCDVEVFPKLKELHLDGVHMDPCTLGSIIQSR